MEDPGGCLNEFVKKGVLVLYNLSNETDAMSRFNLYMIEFAHFLIEITRKSAEIVGIIHTMNGG